MKTLQQFKALLGITEINLVENKKGRKMSFLPNDILLLVSSKCDLTKPLYVNQITKDAKGAPIEDVVYVVFNTDLKEAGTI